MRREGQELVDILSAVMDVGYVPWARAQINNRYVLRHSPHLISVSQLYEMGILRSLITHEKAVVMSQAEQEERDRAIARALRPVISLEDAMQAAGLHNTLMLRQVRKLLEVSTVEQLENVTREDVAELDELSAGERRALWKFVSSHHTAEEKTEYQSKRKKAPAAKQANPGSKKGGKQKKGAPISAPYKERWDLNSACQTMFHPGLPEPAFALMARLLFASPRSGKLTA